jgi:hypothetical protein
MAFYGDPRGRDGRPSATWEREHLVRISPPWTLVTAWDFAPVRSISVHRACAPSLERVFAAIWARAGQSEDQIRTWGMHLFGGAYNFRLMRGGTRLSMHSWGCAVDFDPARNGFGDATPNFALVPAVLQAFDAEGWTWGGRWRTPDGMHWQAAGT